ncbi:hypothetical protein NE237_006105 [Protea cynaroides]|uniref:Uncharacterized protein n=1 Tax=Protea cynaroides TaxID=273540 RepID=A0A9Q0KMG8_9MAGN|nr:hypothetical protein NE237_006105 [Protea cynaroides]
MSSPDGWTPLGNPSSFNSSSENHSQTSFPCTISAPALSLSLLAMEFAGGVHSEEVGDDDGVWVDGGETTSRRSKQKISTSEQIKKKSVFAYSADKDSVVQVKKRFCGVVQCFLFCGASFSQCSLINVGECNCFYWSFCWFIFSLRYPTVDYLDVHGTK